METLNDYKLVPGFKNSFKTGWQVIMDNFLRLFLVVLVLSIITIPFKFPNYHFNPSDFHHSGWNWENNWGHNSFNPGSFGFFAAFMGFIAMLFAFLIAPVFQFGGKIIFVKSVRKIKPEFELLIKGFKENYLHIILANLLVVALVFLGLFALIIPGIIIGCRLVFVGYIIMDKKLDPIEAVELSWKLTKGHGWKIFLMGLASLFIFIFGIILLIVGVFPAIMWISASFASLYESVLRQNEKPLEQIA